MYRVFLVEDEIVTREGIRNNVDWNAAGFEFSGEATDGEMALPLIEETKPDVLITDIKMPFMDGLQLSKIIREHMPWVKIIILSGHDEFEYAQSAVKLGVTEYLLKPISAQDLREVLKGLSKTLDQEHQEREKLKQLQHSAEDNLVLRRGRFLLKLVMGGISSAEAIEQSQQLGLDIVAKYYLVVLARIELCDESQPFDYHKYQRVEHIISKLAGDNLDILLTQKDPEELILLFKGNDREQLVHEGRFLAELVKSEVESDIDCKIAIEVGALQDRLGNIHHSFAEALAKSKSTKLTLLKSPINQEADEVLPLDHDAVENYLKFGSIQDFDAFFSNTIQPLASIALQSDLMKHYLLVDIMLTARQFVSDLDGSVEQLALDVHEIGNVLDELTTVENIRQEMRAIFTSTLSLRNEQTIHERSHLLQQVKAYIDEHFTNSDLQMNKVAQEFNISSSHFSTVFSQEFGETFRDYLSKLRINCAKELLCTTNLKVSEIAYQSGFNDPQYFSVVFKKKTSVTPQQFRTHSHENPEGE